MDGFEKFIKGLKDDRNIPEQVRKQYEDTLADLPEGKAEEKRTAGWRKFAGLAAGLAAVLGLGFFCVGNPAAAEKLPLIGHIFEGMQENFWFQGDYSEVGTPLEEESIAEQLETAAEVEEMESVSQYTKTSDGITITLSEVYCNGQAIYITMQLKSEEKFPEFDLFQFHDSETYSFNPSVQMDDAILEGKFVDDHTYAGMIRLDLNRKRYHNSEMIEIPEDFTLDLSFEFLRAYKSGEGISEEEYAAFAEAWSEKHPGWDPVIQVPKYEGPWDFHLNIHQDLGMTETVEIKEQNELGIGIEKVVKDRFEITVYESYADEKKSSDYMPVFLDAEGHMMQGGESVETVAVGDHDVSKIDIFLMDWDQWMDELKAVYWNQPEGYWDSPDARTEDGRTFKELLLDTCAYHKEVRFGMEK